MENIKRRSANAKRHSWTRSLWSKPREPNPQGNRFNMYGKSAIYIKKENQAPITLTSVPTKNELIEIINSIKTTEEKNNDFADEKTVSIFTKKNMIIGGIVILLILLFFKRKSLKLNVKM
jgi:hypothetical protein